MRRLEHQCLRPVPAAAPAQPQFLECVVGLVASTPVTLAGGEDPRITFKTRLRAQVEQSVQGCALLL